MPCRHHHPRGGLEVDHPACHPRLEGEALPGGLEPGQRLGGLGVAELGGHHLSGTCGACSGELPPPIQLLPESGLPLH
ncbi:MAG: hypothetical protein EA352_12645 [Gemmatimonadales bacterium]|nr:MAG: hypothetical protein EA352_12645 [Gemmatimonadales bacterium]